IWHNRRQFLRGTTATGLALTVPSELFAQASSKRAPQQPAAERWDPGRVRHLLPTVSDTRMLVKASFDMPLSDALNLNLAGRSVRGVMGDSNGEHWHFYVGGLTPGRRYTLSLTGRGRNLCSPWPLSTFPSRNDHPERFRLLTYTCAGGHEVHEFLPTAVRNRLLRRALSFAPDAAIANGDHIYWDLLAPVSSLLLGRSPAAVKLAGTFDRSAVILGGDNESVLTRVAGPQITPVYGTDFRSTPMVFLQDDHDYFDNDEATDEIVTFPPSHFMLQLARATQFLYYPEFLPDMERPVGLPGSSAGDRAPGVSESFGTLRFGRLVEILLYDVRRTQTLAGPSAVFVDLEVEKWLGGRTRSGEVAHLVHLPSQPPGGTAREWGALESDVLGEG